ncbi:hypothetical protein P8C59_009246 [Phyllachora maydis]|uniref:Uncharacterized protein n=1 Tax=Phyllachora maydis TaxID=1825666 RepID=A0AAD9MI44_9PEZI|nr:hypothetical protein P8C59_009246 [Phyllachora maydis]
MRGPPLLPSPALTLGLHAPKVESPVWVKGSSAYAENASRESPMARPRPGGEAGSSPTGRSRDHGWPAGRVSLTPET